MLSVFIVHHRLNKMNNRFKVSRQLDYRVVVGVDEVSVVWKPADSEHDQNYDEHFGQLKEKFEVTIEPETVKNSTLIYNISEHNLLFFYL